MNMYKYCFENNFKDWVYYDDLSYLTESIQIQDEINETEEYEDVPMDLESSFEDAYLSKLALSDYEVSLVIKVEKAHEIYKKNGKASVRCAALGKCV